MRERKTFLTPLGFLSPGQIGLISWVSLPPALTPVWVSVFVAPLLAFALSFPAVTGPFWCKYSGIWSWCYRLLHHSHLKTITTFPSIKSWWPAGLFLSKKIKYTLDKVQFFFSFSDLMRLHWPLHPEKSWLTSIDIEYVGGYEAWHLARRENTEWI